MRTSLFAVITVGLTFMTGIAAACPIGANDDFSPPPVKKPVVQNVSFQASQLFERAAAFETAATSRDASAAALDRQAETLAQRARVLRNQASFVPVADRSSVLAVADELSAKAAADRSRASQERAQAAELRVQARALRERAVQLVKGGSGGGWRGRGVPTPPVSTPQVSAQTDI